MKPRVRVASQTDAEALWGITCEEDVIRFSFEEGPVSLEFFERWLSEYLRREDALIYVCELDGRVVGYIRFVVEPSGVEIDLAVAPGYRRRGFGGLLLNAGADAMRKIWPEQQNMLAVVHAENDRSIKFFRKHAFELSGESVRAGSPVMLFSRRIATRQEPKISVIARIMKPLRHQGMLGALILLAMGISGCESIQSFHAEPYEPYVGGVPHTEEIHGPAHLYFLRFIPDTELIHTAWRDKLGPVDQTPIGYPRQSLPEKVMAYQNRIEWAVRHDEMIQIPFGSMLAAKAYSALQRFYGGQLELKGDLRSLDDILLDPYAHQLIVEVDTFRFFEHPLNHLTIEMRLKLHVYPAGSVDIQQLEAVTLKRNVKLGGLFTSSEDFLSNASLLVDALLNQAFAEYLPQLPTHEPVKPVASFVTYPVGGSPREQDRVQLPGTDSTGQEENAGDILY